MPFLVYALPVAAAAAITIAAAVTRNASRARSLARLALVASVVAVLAVTLTPQSGHNDRQELPFAEIAAALRDWRDLGLAAGVLGNVFLFAPLGAALSCCAVSRRRAVATGAALSVVVECLQLVVPGRTSAVDDVLLNTAGTALGYWAASILLRRSEKQRGATRP